MKRKWIFILAVFWLFSSCDTDSGVDCFKKQGRIITDRAEVEEFSKISISKGIELYIKQAEEYKVRVEAGKNFIDDIKFFVEDGELFIKDNSNCQMLRNYHPAKVYVSTPKLENIYSSSQYNISSEGVLKFPKLQLQSGLVSETPSGIYNLQIENEELKIQDNVSAVYQIQGKTNNLEVWFWGQNGRFEGENLKAKEIQVYHRSANDMFVYPLNKISGTIRLTGNVVLKNIPSEIEVEELSTGKLIFPEE